MIKQNQSGKNNLQIFILIYSQTKQMISLFSIVASIQLPVSLEPMSMGFVVKGSFANDQKTEIKFDQLQLLLLDRVTYLKGLAMIFSGQEHP